jgi:DNA-binding transcriptional ArsR family regulator
MPTGRWEPLDQPPVGEVSLDDVLKALADPARREIVRLLAAEGDRACGTFGLDLAPSTLSHHFRVLREAGILSQYNQGRRRMNALRFEEFERRFPGLLQAVGVLGGK